MKPLLMLFVAISLPVLGQNGGSAFATVRFGNVVQVDLPRNWTYMDRSVANHLNTSSEAAVKLAGVPSAQGDNTILVATNAYDSKGKSMATLRISVRAAPSVTQLQMRELVTQPTSAIEAQLRPTADETAKVMLNAPGVKSYSVRAVKLDRNDSLVCFLSSFEGNLSHGVIFSDTWVCPLEDRTIKLSTSYAKISQSIYRPTLDLVWRSLRAPVPK